MEFNPVELSVIREALQYHAARRAKAGMGYSEVREEVHFINGLKARIGSVLQNHHEADQFCPNCGWSGNTTETVCTCAEPLRLTRSGVRVRDAAVGR